MKILVFIIVYVLIGLGINYVTKKAFDKFGKGLELDGLGVLIVALWPAVVFTYIKNMITK